MAFSARLKKGPLRLAWDEEPVNWVSDQWFEHRRRFTRGPLKELTALLTLEPTPGGCRASYDLTVVPKGLLGRLVAGKVLKAGLENFRKAAASAEAFALGQRTLPFDYAAPPLPGGAAARIERMVERIEATGHGHGLARRLADYVATAQEVDLVHLRPLALARLWDVPARRPIELCLQATREGLLTLKWSLLCPRCRVAKLATASLDALPKGTHCSTCNVDYGRDFAQSVELAFQPSPAIRPIVQGEYCLFGPLSTPHVKLQIALEPGEGRTVAARFAPGPYRYRTLEPGPELEVELTAEPPPAMVLGGDAIDAGAPSPAETIVLENRGKRRLTAVIEERAWVADALTADRAATFQAFRDLFSDQVLRPGDEVAVRHVTLLFTDLRASTALYGRMGDASAYHLVRDHFAFLGRLVREHEGAVVKTIGDAIMAAFHDPADAVRAALAIQDHVAAFNEDHADTPVSIKVGLHGGPLIAVTLNERLDYFGSTANLAARLEAQSEGDDIVLSAGLAAEPGVAELIAGLPSESAAARLKGFEQPVAFVRVRPGGPLAPDESVRA